MSITAFNRRRELAGEHKMQGAEEAKAKAAASKAIAKGELPNPVDGDSPMRSTRHHGHSPSREAEEEYLSKHGVDGDDPPTSTKPGDEVEESPVLPDPAMTVDDDGKENLKVAKSRARSTKPPTVLGAEEGHEPKDRAFTQQEKGTVGNPAKPKEQ